MQLKDLEALHMLHQADLQDRYNRAIEHKDSLYRMQTEYIRSIESRAKNDTEAIDTLFRGLIETETNLIMSLSHELGYTMAADQEPGNEVIAHIPAKRKGRNTQEPSN